MIKKASDYLHFSPLANLKTLRPLSYEELLKDRQSPGSRWANQPDKAKAYVEGRKTTEDTYRKMLNSVGVKHPTDTSLLYSTLPDFHNFPSNGLNEYRFKLSPKEEQQAIFELVGVKKDLPPLVGLNGKDRAVEEWKKIKNKKVTEYMGMKIYPRIEAILRGRYKV